MDVICDTNIWYNIGSGNITPVEDKDVNLWGTFLSIDELSKTGKLLNPDLSENVRRAIQEMIKINVYYMNPLSLDCLSKVSRPINM